MIGTNGHETNWFGTWTDVEDLKRTEEQLRVASKMEALGRLAGGVAHDFNNLLTVIIGYCTVLAKGKSIDTRAGRDLREVLSAAEQAAELTRQLLAFSRHQIAEPGLLDLNQVVEETSLLLQRLLGDNITVRTALDPGIGNVKVDRAQVGQVLMNLAVNARDAMPDGGTLTIETLNVEIGTRPIQESMAPAPGLYTAVAVTDTGHGMDAETLSHIFEPFFTTKPIGQGTGLGLSVAYGIVKRAGGHIDVSSIQGEGTVFRVLLPAVPPERMETGGPLECGSEDTTGAETLLLLEDAAQIRGLMQSILSQQGYTVLEASNAKDALRMCSSHAGPIDLIISDIMLPGASGPDAVVSAQRIRPRMKRLFMSGYANASNHEGYLLDSRDAFIQKPFSPEQLLKAVRDVLDNVG